MITGILARGFLVSLLLIGLESKANVFQQIIVLSIFLIGFALIDHKEAQP